MTTLLRKITSSLRILGQSSSKRPAKNRHFDLNNTAMVRWLMVSSYVSFILTFVAIFHYFFASIQPFYELSLTSVGSALRLRHDHQRNQSCIVLRISAYPSFAQILPRPRGSQQQYARAFALSEFRFVLASAFAKTALIVIIFFGAFRNRDEE